MTSTDEAARHFPMLLAQCRAVLAQQDQPGSIVLSTYETDDDLNLLRPEFGAWSAEFHRAVQAEFVRLLAAEEITAVLKPLNAKAYLRWLATVGLTHSPACRDDFFGQTSGRCPVKQNDF